MAHAADRLAAGIERAGAASARQPVEILERRAPAFRREQVAEGEFGEFGGVIAEQRLGAAVGREHAAGAVEHQRAVGGGVEDRAQLAVLGLDPAQRHFRGFGSLVGSDLGGDHEHQRVLVVPGHAEQAAVDRLLLAVDGGDGERLAAVAGVGRRLFGFDEQAVEPAGFGQRGQIAIAGPVEEGAVGVDQCVEAIDQNADRQTVEDRPAFVGVARGIAIARGPRRRRGLGRDDRRGA